MACRWKALSLLFFRHLWSASLNNSPLCPVRCSPTGWHSCCVNDWLTPGVWVRVWSVCPLQGLSGWFMATTPDGSERYGNQRGKVPFLSYKGQGNDKKLMQRLYLTVTTKRVSSCQELRIKKGGIEIFPKVGNVWFHNMPIIHHKVDVWSLNCIPVLVWAQCASKRNLLDLECSQSSQVCVRL